MFRKRKSVDVKFLKDNIIYPIVCKAREELRNKYDINSDEFLMYRGLSLVASKYIVNEIKKISNGKTNYLDAEFVLCTLRHDPEIPSMYWDILHVYVKVKYRGEVVYADPTLGELKPYFLFDNISDFYISQYKPVWYRPIPANKNVFYMLSDSKIWRKISDWIYAIQSNINITLE